MPEEDPWVMHCFRASETINAVIKLKNGFNLTPTQLEQLSHEFNELNGGVVPKPGMTMKIPILQTEQ